VGYENNAYNAPGRCQGEPACYVGDNRCGEGFSCVGIESNQPGAAGTCQAAPRTRDIRQLYMFFGHNSVGGEIAGGLSRTQTGLNIISRSPTSVSSNGASHFGSANNRQPALLNIDTYGLYSNADQARRQITLFADQVRFIMTGNASTPGQALDIAFVKFCFMIFDDGANRLTTDALVDAFFNNYAEQMDALQRQFPSLILVHFTQTTRPCAYNDPYLHAGNLRRARFRQRMLERYGHTGRVFDLARIEASSSAAEVASGQAPYCSCNQAPEARRAACNNAGIYPNNQVLGLLQSYAPSSTSTDGHLNLAGRDFVARELANFLAQVR
jgi:hypothetical protein